MKICTICGAAKPESEFYSRPPKKPGGQRTKLRRCIPCERERIARCKSARRERVQAELLGVIDREKIRRESVANLWPVVRI